MIRFLNDMSAKCMSIIHQQGGIVLMSPIVFMLMMSVVAWANDDEPSGPSIPPGWSVLDGDIIMPDDIGIAGTFNTNLWPAGRVPFQFASDVTTANRDRMVDAMTEWEAVANIDFVPRTNESDHVFIQNSEFEGWNNSAVGMTGGRQYINIFNWTNRRTLIHELGHTLGFWHEQSRTDRDNYVRIEWDRISNNACGGFPCHANFFVELFSQNFGPYDFGSIMHYRQCSFSTCGSDPCAADPANCRTITVLPPYTDAWQDNLGNATVPSYWDARIASFMYPYSNWRFMRTGGNNTNAGTFLSPWLTFSHSHSNTPVGGTLWVLDEQTIAGPRTLTRQQTIRAALGSVVFR